MTFHCDADRVLTCGAAVTNNLNSNQVDQVLGKEDGRVGDGIQLGLLELGSNAYFRRNNPAPKGKATGAPKSEASGPQVPKVYGSPIHEYLRNMGRKDAMTAAEYADLQMNPRPPPSYITPRLGDNLPNAVYGAAYQLSVSGKQAPTRTPPHPSASATEGDVADDITRGDKADSDKLAQDPKNKVEAKPDAAPKEAADAKPAATSSLPECGMERVFHDQISPAGENPICISKGFKTTFMKLGDIAKEVGVRLIMIGAARKHDKGIELPPGSEMSNHRAGHAIDVKITADGVDCDVKCLSTLSGAPSKVQTFIEKVEASGIAWGGRFQSQDPVHFDDRLNTQPEEWKKEFVAVQQAFIDMCVDGCPAL